ncbi:MAG: TonB-dependent receptor [Bacteroides sp.]|nr:TonB-dependent receptor [Bacteroides sp.]
MKPRKFTPIFSRHNMLKLAALACLGCFSGIPAAYAEPLPVAAPQAETGTVTGVITDSEGEPLIGASVIVKGTSNGTSTDLDGKFTLKGAAGKELQISYVGYQTITVKVPAGKTDLGKIVLESDAQLLKDVVVIGYGTAKKGDITSAVASVKAEDFTQGKIGDAAELIKGKVAGLTVVNSSGNPTAGSSIRLRGITTLTGSLEPLVLVDGIEGSLNTVAPENIASIDVLKDASAAAIYGTRGANGVIIITTKGGTRDAKATATYSDYFSFSNWGKKAKMMDYSDVLYGRTAYDYAGYETDWLAAVTRKSGFKHNHDFQVSGGTSNSTYSGDFSYQKEEGIMQGSDNERLRFHVNYYQYFWNDILKVGFDAMVNRQKYSLNSADYVYRQAIIRNPSEPIYNEDGSYYENFNRLQYYNPVEITNEYFGNAINRFSQITGTVTLEPIKGWKTNLILSMNEYANSSESYTTSKHYSLATQKDYNGSASKGYGNSYSKSLEVTTGYNNTFNGKHRLDALLGYSYLYNSYDGFGASNGNFSTETYLWNNLGNGSLLTEEDRHAGMSSYKNDDKLIGFFGRVSYGFDNRYNILASVRREGSSKFGKNHKWGTFPSVSLGWNIMNEEFMTSSRDWLNNLRLRIGYGVTGVIPDTAYLSMYLYNYAGWGDILSMDGTWIKSLEVTQNPNPDLKWETTNEWNFGLDFGFFNNRLRGSFDFYVKTTNDLLYEYNVPVPPNLYPQTLANVGSMRNIGQELLITGVPVETRDFSWETTLTLSHNSNKLLSLSNDLYETDNFQEEGGISDPISVVTHCMEVGHPLGDFWGLKCVGYDKNGFALVEVSDGNGGWTVKPFSTSLNSQENRQRLGSGAPKLTLGWSNQFTYRDFDLSMQFTGQFGYKILNAQRCFYENNSIAYNRLKSAADLHPAVKYVDGVLQPELDANGNQLMVTLSNSMDQGFWSDHLENGDYFKLSALTLGYRVPFKGSITKFISNLRIYGSMTNVFTLTKYSGLDPEVSNYFRAPSIDDRDKYPTTRSYTVGLQVTF